MKNIFTTLDLELYSRTGPIARLCLRGKKSSNKDNLSVFRLFRTQDGVPCPELGFMIAPHRDGEFVGFIDVLAGDLVVLRRVYSRGLKQQLIAFRVDTHFGTQRLTLSGTGTAEEIVMAMVSTTTKEKLTTYDEWHSGLKTLIQGAHSDAIRKIINAQINAWKSWDLESLICYAPQHIDLARIDECTVRYPFFSLKHLRDRLSSIELQCCITASPEGAVRYAFDQLTDQQLEEIADDYPELIITYAADRVPVRMLRHCCYTDPDLAYAAREAAAPELKALLLSYTLDMAGLVFSDQELAEYREEIEASLIEFYAIWVIAYKGDWTRLCMTLQSNQIYQFNLIWDMDRDGAVDPWDEPHE